MSAPMDELLVEISTALGDIVAHLDAGTNAAVLAKLASISETLAAAVSAPKEAHDYRPLVEAISRLKLQVNAAPITVAAPTVVVQAPSAAEWVFDVEYGYGNRISQIRATQAKPEKP